MASIRAQAFFGLAVMSIVVSSLVLVSCSREPTKLHDITKTFIQPITVGDEFVVPATGFGEPGVFLELIGHDVVIRTVVADELSQHFFQVPNSRLPPKYVDLSVIENPGMASVKVQVSQATENARLSLRVFRVEGGVAATKLVKAFRLYSEALEVDAEGERLNPESVILLSQAADLFEKGGRADMARWSRAIAAKYQLWPDLDFGASLRTTENALASMPEMASFSLELMLRNLRGVLLTEICRDNPYPDLLGAREAALEEFSRAASLAKSAGWDYEYAWARNNSGITSFYMGRMVASLAHYDAAFEVASSLGDDWFIQLIKHNIANTRDQKRIRNDLLASLPERRAEVTEQRRSGTVGTLSHALIAVGTTYLQLHMFPEAIEVLSEALDLHDPVEELHESSRAYLWLAQAYRAMGNRERAGLVLTEAITRLERAGSCKFLEQAYGMKAQLARFSSDKEALKHARQEQQRYLLTDEDQASFAYERARDLLAFDVEYDSAFEQAISTAVNRATELPDGVMRSSLLLGACSMAAEQKLKPAGCALSGLRAHYDRLLAQSTPSTELGAMQDWARLQEATGSEEFAVETYRRLVARIGEYRRALPGVLGSWYWEGRAGIFDRYLSLLIQKDLRHGNSSHSLAALDSLRNLDASARLRGPSHSSEFELRTMVLSLDAQEDTVTADRVRRQIDLQLAQLSTDRKAFEPTNAEEVEYWLRSLPEYAAVVAFHFAANDVWRWYGTASGGYSLARVGERDDIEQQLGEALNELRVFAGRPTKPAVKRVSQRLFGGLSESPPELLVHLAAGPLNGFPLNALQWNGAALQTTTVVAIAQSAAAMTRINGIYEAGPNFSSAFVAGAYGVTTSGLSGLHGVEKELALINEHLSAVEIGQYLGAAFDRAAVASQDFQQAELIHLASHASTDLAYPELSRLYLGSSQSNADFLTPIALYGTPLNARLVVLSACETSGQSRFTFDSNVGFVSSFLNNGADVVMATLWPISDEATSVFISYFYQQLASGESIAQALKLAKSGSSVFASESNESIVAAFQLYVR